MRSPIFYAALALIVIGVIVGVYYLIPGIHHVLILSLQGRGVTDPNAARPLHAVAGFVVAVVGIALLVFTGRKKAQTA